MSMKLWDTGSRAARAAADLRRPPTAEHSRALSDAKFVDEAKEITGLRTPVYEPNRTFYFLMSITRFNQGTGLTIGNYYPLPIGDIGQTLVNASI